MSQRAIDAVAAAHSARWQRPADVIVGAPGRVNLIGEHIDYSLLPVMPVALEQRIVVAASSGVDGSVRAMSIDHAGAAVVTGDSGPLDGWHRYLSAAIREAGVPASGADLTVGGDLPSTGGLSSSSALTIGLIAALSRLAGRDPSGADIIAMAVAAERGGGVEGGAMDQTVIVHAVAGAALRIEFAPPAHRVIALPEGIAWVAASSGQTAPKATDARDAYNSRVVASRAAAAWAAAAMQVEIAAPPLMGPLMRLAGLEAVTAALEELPPFATATEVATHTGRPIEDLVGLVAGTFDGTRRLEIADVGHHIVGEAARVDALEGALQARDPAEIGRVLDASHASLARYGVVTEPLDRVCGAMRDAGAHGARVTGAGFGGYAVAACSPDDVDDVIAAAIAATGGPAFVVRPSEGLR